MCKVQVGDRRNVPPTCRRTVAGDVYKGEQDFSGVLNADDPGGTGRLVTI
jgi:hypothetical protein